MLRGDVVEAAAAGKFRLISTVDEGIELLTGRPAGTQSGGGGWSKDSVNALVEARMRSFAEQARAFSSMREGREGWGPARR